MPCFLSQDMGGCRTRKEINQIYNSFLMDVSSPQDVGTWHVALLGGIGLAFPWRRNAEITAFVFVKEPAED